MKEILTNTDVKLYEYYVVRNNKLFMINKYDINIGEMYCYPAATPSTPPDIMLLKDKRGVEKDPFYAFDPTENVINMDYFNPVGIKNYILNIGKFKNWWE